MARAERDESTDLTANAVDLLTRDHRLVERLFESLSRAAPQQLDPIARRLAKMVRIHTQIEEELFYPVSRRAIGDEPIDEAEHEHADATASLARLESLTSEHPEFQNVVATLREQITAHVDSEETDLFPRVRKTDIDLVALGIALAERRDTLMDVLGLHDDDEIGAATMREVQQAASDARSIGRSG